MLPIISKICTRVRPLSQAILHIAIPENVLAQELGEEIVLLNLETEAYYSLNPTGSHLWKLLTGVSAAVDFDHIIHQLSTLYAVEEETLRQDMQALLDELVQEGLLIIKKEQA